MPRGRVRARRPAGLPGRGCRVGEGRGRGGGSCGVRPASCPGNRHGEAGVAAVVMLLRLRRCCRSRAVTGSGTSSQSAPSLSGWRRRRSLRPSGRRCRSPRSPGSGGNPGRAGLSTCAERPSSRDVFDCARLGRPAPYRRMPHVNQYAAQTTFRSGVRWLRTPDRRLGTFMTSRDGVPRSAQIRQLCVARPRRMTGRGCIGTEWRQGQASEQPDSPGFH